ncbi:MAG TPA: hypothetical protein VFK40_02615 [Nitrososphaeraceae archaeon]|nr:hypothetical protein [Nitrososphaeraceae archaeon]
MLKKITYLSVLSMLTIALTIGIGLTVIDDNNRNKVFAQDMQQQQQQKKSNDSDLVKQVL